MPSSRASAVRILLYRAWWPGEIKDVSLRQRPRCSSVLLLIALYQQSNICNHCVNSNAIQMAEAADEKAQVTLHWSVSTLIRPHFSHAYAVSCCIACTLYKSVSYFGSYWATLERYSDRLKIIIRANSSIGWRNPAPSA